MSTYLEERLLSHNCARTQTRHTLVPAGVLIARALEHEPIVLALTDEDADVRAHQRALITASKGERGVRHLQDEPSAEGDINRVWDCCLTKARRTDKGGPYEDTKSPWTMPPPMRQRLRKCKRRVPRQDPQTLPDGTSKGNTEQSLSSQP